MRFELVASQTVGIGDLPRMDDRRAVTDALRRADSLDVVHTLPRGLETPLGRSMRRVWTFPEDSGRSSRWAAR